MTVIDEAVDAALRLVPQLDPGSRIYDSVHFFIADSITIMLLLFAMIMVMGFIRTYIPEETIRKKLSGKNGPGSHLAASVFGSFTPFCSCSSIPIFLSFLRAGVPLGVTFSFLVTSPIVNEYLVILMLAFFGIKITAIYVVSGIAIGTICGMILGRLGLEKEIRKDMKVQCTCACKGPAQPKTYRERLAFGYREAASITRKLWIWILVAVGIGAVIHNYVPEGLIESAVAGVGPLAVPIATILGVPMYGNCAAILPIAVALFQRGLPLGTALAFMMSTSALSIPEATLLRRAMSWKLVAIFFAIVTVAIIITGYAFNFIAAALA